VLAGEPSATIAGRQMVGIDEKLWCTLMHLSQLTWVTGVGVLLPIILWLLSKEESELTRRHGARMMNWLISCLIYTAADVVLLWVLVGFFVLPVVAILNVIFPIIAAVKFQQGEVWS